MQLENRENIEALREERGPIVMERAVEERRVEMYRCTSA